MERLIEYTANHPWLATFALVAAALVIAFEIRARAGASQAVSPQEAIRLMNHGALVLDLRPQQDYAAGHLSGAKHMPADQILQAGTSLKKHKDKPIVVYCGTGSLGAPAVRQLAAQGFTKAFNLRGGLAAWRAENLPVVKS